MDPSRKYTTHRGFPNPLGPSKKEKGVNFALFSEHATSVFLLLYAPKSAVPFLKVELGPSHRTGHVWHILVDNLPEEVEYAYEVCCKGSNDHACKSPRTPLLDPYARAVSSFYDWGESHLADLPYRPKGRIVTSSSFDWQNVKSPLIPFEELVIYETHVRGFTKDGSSKVSNKGTFLGLIEKIPYLKKLGVNAVELLPVFEFNECENRLKNPQTGKKLYNFWGYSTVNFFAPMQRYAAGREWDSAIQEFKMMVRELHKNRIEVILDVVYNHTAEGNENGPVLSFKGIDNSVYYLLGPDGRYMDFSGTGNTFNCNHPAVMQLILDSLRYWVGEMRVDGFRFDLASILTRDCKGVPLAKPPIVQAINNDPLFSNVKWIAEAWDAAGLYQVGSFPGEGKWAEWNGQYRDVVRKFIKGTDGMAGSFAGAISGSENLYGKDRKPYHSINFVTAHDGYSLRDLVSYQEKHNEENGEGNKDGSNQNDSWNCGAEGKTNNRKIHELRLRQMKNFHAALMLSIGTPMILMGDEYGHTRNGNNNPYSQDNELNWFLWDIAEKEKDLTLFHARVNELRKRNKRLFCRREFLKPEDVDWHGHKAFEPDWGPTSRFVAYTLKDHEFGHHVFVAFNAHYEKASIQIPKTEHRNWYRIVDTALHSPEDFVEHPQMHPPMRSSYQLQPYSMMIAQAF